MNATPAAEEIVQFLTDELRDGIDRFHFQPGITQADFGKVHGQWVLILWIHGHYRYTRITGKHFLHCLYSSLSDFTLHVLGSTSAPRLIVGRVNCRKMKG
jgi:hypothetical protein